MNKKVQFLGLKTINWSCGNKIKNKTKIAHCWKSSKFLSKIVVNDTIDTLSTRVPSQQIQRSNIYYGY
jgi:hypothetical protein